MDRIHSIHVRNVLLALAGAGMFVLACSTVPITGRQQLNLVSETEMQGMS
jgi:hypothetical protein